MPQPDRNLLLWMFAALEARSVFADWEKEAAAQLGRFRTAAARHLADPSFTELIERLHATGPEARARWKRHDVVPSEEDTSGYATPNSARSSFSTSFSRSRTTPSTSSSPSRQPLAIRSASPR